MAKIKIISGAYGYKPMGSMRHRVASKGEVIEVKDDEAKRLIEIGVAEFADENISSIKSESVAIAPDGTKADKEQNNSIADEKRLKSAQRASKKKMPKIEVEDPV